jgi:hypothetical protein
VFDRLLGANQFCPETNPSSVQPCAAGKAEPPIFAQRPFDYAAVSTTEFVWHDLGIFPNAESDHYGLRLNFTPNKGSSFGLLAPSISHLAMDESKQQLTICGIFGQDPRPEGSVTVGGTAVSGGPEVHGGTQVSIESWTPTPSGSVCAEPDQIVVDFYPSQDPAQPETFKSPSGDTRATWHS